MCIVNCTLSHENTNKHDDDKIGCWEAGGRSLQLDMGLDRIGLKHWHSLGGGSCIGEEVF